MQKISQSIDPNTKVAYILEILDDMGSEHKKLTTSYIDQKSSKFTSIDLFNRRMNKIFGYMKEISNITNPEAQYTSPFTRSPLSRQTVSPHTPPIRRKDPGYDQNKLKIKAILLDPSLQSNQFVDEKARLILESLPQPDQYFAHLGDTPDSIGKGLTLIRKQLSQLKTKLDRVKINNGGQDFVINNPSVVKLMDEMGLIQNLLNQFTFNVDDVVSQNSSQIKPNYLGSIYQDTPNTIRSGISLANFTFKQSPLGQAPISVTSRSQATAHFEPRNSIQTEFAETLRIDCQITSGPLTSSLAGEGTTTSAFASLNDFLVVKYNSGLSLFKDGKEFFTSKPIYCIQKDSFFFLLEKFFDINFFNHLT